MSMRLRPAPVTGTVDENLVRTIAGALVLVFGGVAAILAWTAPEGGFAGLWVTFALHLVPGAVVGLSLRLRGFALALATIFGSEAVLILVAMPMAWFGWWHVRPVTTVLLVALSSFGATIATGDLRRIDRQAPREVARRVRLWTFGPGGLATIGFALAMAAARPGLPEAWGAVVAAGPLAWLGLVVIVVAVVWAFGGGGSLGWTALALATVVPTIQAATYGLPTVEVAARHVGIAQAIIDNGKLFPSADIYQAWSGLFAATAFVKVASGWSDLLLYASIWGVVASGMMMMAVRAVAGQFHNEERAWATALIFGLGCSLNPGFFAPQMFGFVGALIVVVLLLRPPEPHLPKHLVGDGVVLISAAIAVTHQLSPYMATLAVVALTATRLVKSWTAWLLPLVPAALFALVNREVLGPYVSHHDLGQFLENLRPPRHSQAGSLEPALVYKLTFYAPSVALFMIGLAALVAVAMRRRDRQSWALVVAAGSPVGLLLGSSYGNEGIFRVALFALPWLAILAAYLLPEPGRRFWALRFHPVRTLAVLALTMVNVIGSTYMDDARVIRAADVSAVTWIERTVPADSYVFMLGTDISEPLYVTGRKLTYISREVLFNGAPDAYPATSGAAYDPAADLAKLTVVWATQPTKHRYVLATDVMAISSERYGQQLMSDQARLEAALRATTVSWKLVYEGQGARVYEFLGVT